MKTIFTLRTGLLLAFILALTNIMAQSTGDYRTTAATAMSSINNWQTYNGTSWVAATTALTGNPTVSQNGNTSTSTSVTLTAANPLIRVNQYVTGNGVQLGTIVAAISGTALTLSKPTTDSRTPTLLTFVDLFGAGSGTTTSGGPTLTLTTANDAIVAGMGVSGAGVAYGATVVSVAGTVVTLSLNSTSSTSGTITFYTKETTATTTAGSTTITLNAPNSLVTVGMNVYGGLNDSFPYGATVTSVSGTTIGVSIAPTVTYSFGLALVFPTNGTISNVYVNHATTTGNNSKRYNIGNVFVNDASSINAGTGAAYTNATLGVGGIGSTSNIFTCKKLTVAPLANVNVALSTSNFFNVFDLNGGEGGNAIDNSGTINLFTSPGATTTKTNIVFSPSGTTTIAGAGTFTYNTFSVNKSGASVLIDANSTTTGGTISSGASLTVNEGKILTNTGTLTNTGDLILKSSTTGTASLLSTATVNNVTQQRYLNSNQRGWRLLSNPVADTTFGTVATNSTTPLTLGAGAAKTYDSVTNTWTADGDDISVWASQTAKSLFIRGISSEVTGTSYSVNPPSNVTVAIKGAATNVAPAQIVTTAGQYYLVANPYTAPVSVYSIIVASTGLSNTVSYYNPTIGSSGSDADLKLKYGGYTNPIISATAQGDANDVIIPPMGAIFVQATSNGAINVPKTAIFTGPVLGGSYTHKTVQTKVASNNALKVEVSSDGTYYDTLALQFKAVGDSGSNIDFGKLPNTVLDLYSINGINKMAVSELELKEQTISLGIASTIQKNYTINVAENTIPAGYDAVLVDKVLNTKTVLSPGTNYNFTIDSTPASQGEARFSINMKTSGSLSLVEKEFDSKIQLWPNPAHNQFNILNAQNQNAGTSTIEISSLNGQLIHSQKSNPGTTTTVQTNGWAAGVYILKASNNGTQTTKKLVIQ